MINEVIAAMKGEVNLALKVADVLRDDPSLERGFKTTEFLENLMAMMTIAFTAEQQSSKMREGLLRKSGGTEDNIGTLVVDVAEAKPALGAKPVAHATGRATGVCHFFNSKRGCNRSPCLFKHEKDSRVKESLRQKAMCFATRDGVVCDYGDACKFSHETSGGKGGKGSNSKKSDPANDKKAEADSKKKKRVC